MKKNKWIINLALSSILLLGALPAWGVDVYVVYSSIDKPLQKTLKKSLPSSLKIRSYNIDLLTMADYSGKQKALIKIMKARIVVIIKPKARGIIGEQSTGDIIYIAGKDDLDTARNKIRMMLPEENEG